MTIATYVGFHWQEQRRIATHAHFDASVYARMLSEGARSYVRLNQDVAGIFSMALDVRPQGFEAYIDGIRAREGHPGLNYIGYLPRVADGQAARFEAEARKTMPSFAIQSNKRNAGAVFPLLYAAPFDGTVKRFLGFDYAMIPERREAMQKAAALGKSVATRKAAYLSTPAEEDYVFIFTPVQGRAALSGYIFSIFQLKDMVEGIMGAGFRQQFDLEIYDGELKLPSLLYDEDGRPHTLEDAVSPAAYTETIDFAGRKWILYFHPKAAYTNRYALPHSWLILLSGGLGSIVLAWLTWKYLHWRRAQRRQAEHAQRFHAVFEHHPSAVFALDTQWCITNANAQTIQQLQTTRDKLLGASLLTLVAEEDAQRVEALLAGALTAESDRFDSTLVTGGGKRIEVSVVLMPVTTGGAVSGLLGIADNVTERRQSESRLRETRQMLQLVIDNIPQRVFWKDTELYFLGCNKAFCKDAGLDHPDQIVGKTDSDFPWKDEAEVYRQDDLRTIEHGKARINYEEPQHRQDGKLSWLRTSKIPLTDGHGHKVGVLGMYEDITERKRLEQRLEHMAMVDSLTGLPNRAHFLARLEQAVDKAEWHGSLVTLMYFDIDKFKQVNDRFGHDVGDQVIAAFASRVRSAIRESDVVGRLGGDEFCLLAELPNAQTAPRLAAKLIDAMRLPIQAGDTAVQVGTSIGIAFHAPGTTADALIRLADQAMYAAKQAGGNRYTIAPHGARAA